MRIRTRAPILGFFLALSLVLAVLGLRSAPVAAYPAPPPGAVFLGGDAGQYLAMVDGGAVGWSCINLAGGSSSICPGTLPAADLSPGSNGNCLTTSGGVSTWGSCGSSGITAGTGPVTFSGSGSVATTITPGTAGQILQSNGTPATVWVSPSGDWTINSSGVDTVTQAKGGAAGSGVVFGTNGQIDGYYSTTDAWEIQTNGASATNMALWLGSGNLGNASEFAILGTGTSTQVNAPIGGTLYYSVGGYASTTANTHTASAFTFGTSLAVTTGGIDHIQSGGVDVLTIGGGALAGLGIQNTAITIATSGTTTVSNSATPYPLLIVNTVTLIGAATLTFPNVEGLWWVDVNKISGLNNVLTIKSGSGTCGTVSALTTNLNVIGVYAEGSNTCVLNY